MGFSFEAEFLFNQCLQVNATYLLSEIWLASIIGSSYEGGKGGVELGNIKIKCKRGSEAQTTEYISTQ